MGMEIGPHSGTRWSLRMLRKVAKQATGKAIAQTKRFPRSAKSSTTRRILRNGRPACVSGGFLLEVFSWL